MNCNTGIWWKTLTAAAAVGILAAGPVAAQKTSSLSTRRSRLTS